MILPSPLTKARKVTTLMSKVRTGHPRIWTFMATLNDIVQDIDNDKGRLCRGKSAGQEKSKMSRTVNVGVFTNKDSLMAITHRGNT